MERDRFDVIVEVMRPRINASIGVHVEAEEAAEIKPELVGPGDPKRRKDYYVSEDGTAVIHVMGSLMKRSSWLDAMSGMSSYAAIEREFRDAVADSSIKRIVLEVDSYGGEAAGVMDLSDVIYSARGTKPIIGVANDAAFSAAYAILSATDKIFVNRTSGVGSVGVVAAHIDRSELNSKLGIKVTYIYAGAKKVQLNPNEPLSKEAKSTLQAEIDRLYDIFAATVARNRGMDVDKVRGTEAGLFWGDNGIKAGLADDLATMPELLADIESITGRTYSLASASAGAIPKQEIQPMEVEETADATANVEQPANPAPVASAPTVPILTADEQIEVQELCAMAGKPLATALEFQRKGMKPAAVRKALLTERIDAAAEAPTNSMTLPSTGTNASMRPEDSPLVKDAEARAAAAKSNGGVR